MKNIKKVVAIILAIMLVTLLISIPKLKVEAAESDPYVLFFGNSKTFYNIYPRMFRLLSNASGRSNIKIQAVVAGSRTLEYHADILESIYDSSGKVNDFSKAKTAAQAKGHTLLEDEYKAYKAAFEKNCKYLVLQEQTDNASNKTKMLKASKRIIAILKKYGKNKNFTVIYNAIWPRYPNPSEYQTRDAQMKELNNRQSAINKVCTQVANETGGKVSYSGQAIYNYLKYNNAAYSTMYISDKNHPTQAGSYLSACCLYSAIYGQSPVGIKYYGKVEDASNNPIINLNYAANSSSNSTNSPGRKNLSALDANTVNLLQNVAYRTMFSAPTITINKNNNNVTNQNIQLTASVAYTRFELDSNPYSWNGGSYGNQNNITITENGTYSLTVKDNMGNVYTQNIAVTNIDKAGPTISLVANTQDWAQKVRLTVTATDSSGIPSANAYSWDDMKTWTTQNYIDVNQIGTYIVHVKDNAGNISIASINVNKIDIFPPIIEKLKQQLLENGYIRISANAKDNQSGIPSVNAYSWDNMQTWTTQNYIDVYENGTYTVHVKDNAGNIGSHNTTVNIDRQAPKLKVDYSNKNETTDNVIVTITSDEEVKPIQGWELSQDKKTLTKRYENNTSQSEKVIVEDLNGNQSVEYIEIKNIITWQSTVYNIEAKYISNITPNTTVENFKKNIKTSKQYTITKKDNTVITEKDILGTGCKVKFANNEIYEVIVKGDLDSDGIITITDLVKIKKHIVGKETLQGIYMKAGDVNKNNDIEISDLVRMKKAIIGISDI